VKPWLFCLLFLCSELSSRPLGYGFKASDTIDFDARWNKDLEGPEEQPYLHLNKPYWSSHRQKHLDALDLPLKKQPNPLDMPRRSIQLRAWLVDAGQWDLVHGFSLTAAGGPRDALGFDTKGLAYEIMGRARIGGYRSFLSWLRFDDREEKNHTASASGYDLVFGDRHSEVSALSNTDLNLLRAGNERQIYQGHGGRLSFLQGLSYLDLKRFERIRGQDRSGLNSQRMPRDPAVPAGASDPVVLEQGEDSIDKDGLGGFLGLRFQQEINRNLSLNVSASIHYMKLSNTHSLQVDQISAAGLRRTVTNTKTTNSQGEPVIDLEFEVQKWFRADYNFSVGLRFLDFGEGSLTSLGNQAKDSFYLRGVQVGFQKLF